VTIRGIADPDVLGSRDLRIGERIRVNPEQERVLVLWETQNGDVGYVLARFQLENPDREGAFWTCRAGTVYTGESGQIKVVADDGSVITLSATTTLAALGPSTADLTGDGRVDVPFVTDGGKLKLTDGTNATTTIATSSDIPGNIEPSKTRLAVGTWNGSATSVFFVDENHDTMYRVRPGESPTEVVSPGDGAQAIIGLGDIDGDGTDELVFADASQQLRYVEPNGTVRNLDNGQAGSNNGIGGGAIVDFDNDGVDSVVTVDGSNDVKITSEPIADGGEGTTIISAADAKKAPVTIADVDGDTDQEIVYVGETAGKLKYIDDVRDGNDIAFLRDDDGDKVDGSDEVGVL